MANQKTDDNDDPIIRALEQSRSDVDDVETRHCSDEGYGQGIEYGIYGEFIDIRAILDAVQNWDSHFIGNISYFDAHFNGTPHLSVFVIEESERSAYDRVFA